MKDYLSAMMIDIGISRIGILSGLEIVQCFILSAVLHEQRASFDVGVRFQLKIIKFLCKNFLQNSKIAYPLRVHDIIR